MKSIIFALLPLAVSSAVITPRTPQTIPANSPLGPLAALLKGGNGTASVVLPRAKLYKVTKIPSKVREGATRTINTYGPYVLPGRGQPKMKSMGLSLDPNGQAFIDIIDTGLCKNCTVLFGRTGLSFADGSEAGPSNGVYVHHVISVDISKPANLPLSKCGDGKKPRAAASLGITGSEFLAQGDDSAGNPEAGIRFTSKDGQYQSGFLLGGADKIFQQIDLVNLNNATTNVFVNYEIEYVDGHIGSDAAATLMSVTGCDGGIAGGALKKPEEAMAGHAHGDSAPAIVQGAIKLNKTGIAVTQSPNFPIKADGIIISAMGHMHDGGSAMLMYINDKQVCSSKAIYGRIGNADEETIERMENCGKNIPIKKGDILRLESVYDLKTHPLRTGAEHNSMGTADVMGMFYLTFAVDEAKNL